MRVEPAAAIVIAPASKAGQTKKGAVKNFFPTAPYKTKDRGSGVTYGLAMLVYASESVA
jgi:hypothetical protein